MIHFPYDDSKSGHLIISELCVTETLASTKHECKVFILLEMAARLRHRMQRWLGFTGRVHFTFSMRLFSRICAWRIRSCAGKATNMQALANLTVATKPALPWILSLDNPLAVVSVPRCSADMMERLHSLSVQQHVAVWTCCTYIALRLLSKA